MKTVLLAGALIMWAVFHSGCISHTPPARVDTRAAAPATMAELAGQWVGFASQGDPWNLPGVSGLTLRPDGTGEKVNATIFAGRNGRDYWIYKADVRIRESATGQWVLDQTGPVVTLEGGGAMGMRYKPPVNVPLLLTPQGLVFDWPNENDRYHQRLSADPAASTRDFISREIAARRTRMSAGGAYAQQPAQSGNAGQLHAMSSAFQFGAGLGALDRGNQAAAATAFEAARRSAENGLAGKPFDAAGATQDALRTGAALAGAHNALLADQLQPPRPAGTSAAAGAAVPQSLQDDVTVDAAMMSAYEDGRAYDVLVLLPHGDSAGEFCFQYGIPKANALSLLEYAYAVAGDTSTYGNGSPRRQISYRSYPISVGQTLRMGVEFKPGQFVSKPANYTAHGILPLR